MSNTRMPAEARSLLPLASIWGVPDDVYRSIKVEDAANEDLQELVERVNAAGPQVYDWLEAATDLSDAQYVALSCLTMAAEEARAVLRGRLSS